MMPEPGRRLGPYEIQGRLGGGGMGHVYLGWDARLHREVAIKLLNAQYAIQGMRERFLREARAASALNHPNICTIFDIGEQDGEPYLVMELLKGETLRDRILRQVLPNEELICIAREAAEALGAAHAKGVIHRDIKPANLFLVTKPNGGTQTKILDFGLAKIEGGVLGARSRSLELTTVGATVGTLAYMSPEQARGEALDARSDLFSLGVVLYETATRRLPFKGATSALSFVKLLHHAPDPVREWNDEVPRALEKIILTLLAKDPADRYQTARELESALTRMNERASAGGWLRRAVSLPLRASGDPVARQRRLRPATSIAAASGSAEVASPSALQSDRGYGSGAASGGLAASRGAELQPSLWHADRRAILESEGTSPAPHQLEMADAATPSLERNAEDGHSSTLSSRANPRATFLPADMAQAGREPGAGVVPGAPGAESWQPSEADQARLPLRAGPSSWELEERQEDLRSARRSRAQRLSPWWVWSTVAIVAGCAVLFWFFTHRGDDKPLLRDADAVVMTEVENRTENKLLDHTLGVALDLALEQSPYLDLRSSSSYHLAYGAQTDGERASAAQTVAPDRQAARRAAGRLNAKVYLFGNVSGGAASYHLHVALLDVASDHVLGSVDEDASSLQEIPSAIDRLAAALRLLAGEPQRSIETHSVALAQEATGNLDALRLLERGRSLVAQGHTADALQVLHEAAVLDPHCPQIYLLRTEILSGWHAESAAAESARLAVAAAVHASDRTRALAGAAYEQNATGDLSRAGASLRGLMKAYPHDPGAAGQMAEVLRLEGHVSEALQVAQRAYSDDPWNVAAYGEALRALMALDRYDSAYRLSLQMQRKGIRPTGTTLLAAYVAGQPVSLAEGAVSGAALPSWSEGVYLDNVGRLNEGAAVWRSRVDANGDGEGMRSASASFLAQGSLNRALLGLCSAALGMAGEAEQAALGRMGLFATGLSYALCGDRAHAQRALAALIARYPQSFEANNYLVPDLRGALALDDLDPDAALEALHPARAFDLISLTPFLRGRAHMQLHQVEIGVVDYQAALAHHGTAVLSGTTSYPASELACARAFAAIGDTTNGGLAYRRFLELWSAAEPGNLLIAEAKQHLRL